MAAPVGGAPSMRERFNRLDINDLIERKLADKHTPFTIEERIALLVGCIRKGEEQVTRVGQEAAQSPIVFLGNTGSGKSTLVNYLAGCEMERIDPRVRGIKGLGHSRKIVVVKEESAQLEVMKIGHSKISETFMPNIALFGRRALCDCPGFFDNRAVEIDIANIVNTRRVLLSSQGPRLVILISYYSLQDGRAAGLQRTIKVAEQLFECQGNLQSCRNSFLVGITQVPRMSHDSIKTSLEELKSWIRSDDAPEELRQLSDYERELVRVFADRLFVYDPTEAVEDLVYDGGLNRGQLLEKLDQLAPIPDPRRIFRIAMDPEKAVALRKLCQETGEMITNSLAREKYNDANFLLELTRAIKVIEHEDVDRFVKETEGKIIDHFKGLVTQLLQELSAHPDALSEKAQRLLEIVSSGIAAFDPDDVEAFEKAIDLNDLKSRCQAHSRRVEFFQNESRLKILASQFKDRCFALDFETAERLLQELTGKITHVNDEYRDLNLESSLNIGELRALLESGKQRQAEIDLTKKELEDQKQRYDGELQKMQSAREEDRKAMQASMQGLQGQIAALQRQKDEAVAAIKSNRDRGFFLDIAKLALPYMFPGK